jgi:hypothetical protein
LTGVGVSPNASPLRFTSHAWDSRTYALGARSRAAGILMSYQDMIIFFLEYFDFLLRK